MKTSKSTLTVARMALRAAHDSLPDYAYRKSPKKLTRETSRETSDSHRLTARDSSHKTVTVPIKNPIKNPEAITKWI